VDANTQTAAPNNQPVNPPFIRSGHLTAPGFSEHRIYWEEYGSLAGEPVIVMHGGPGAGGHSSSARFSIRSDTASCFSTSAVARREHLSGKKANLVVDRNLDTFARIMSAKYERGEYRPYSRLGSTLPSVDITLEDIAASGETLTDSVLDLEAIWVSADGRRSPA
jgi:hypothetical protein